MSRYLGPKCRLCRKEGVKLFLKGDRCFTTHCPLDKKGAVAPGQHGMKRKRKPSDYGNQLREKQKAKRIYGIRERQFKNYYTKAIKDPQITGLKLLQLLELRLDNVLYRGGLVLSRSAGRQLIRHGFCQVEGRKVDIPSYQVKVNQVVNLNPAALNNPLVKKALNQKNKPPKWLSKKAALLKVISLPKREEIEADLQESLIVEFYSR